MSTNRIQHLRAVGLMVTVGLLLALAVQVGLTAAAAGTSGVSSGEALQGKVRIHLEGTLIHGGPQCNAVSRGRFTLSGAISDHGRFVDRFHGCFAPYSPNVRTLLGAKGMIRIAIDGGGINYTRLWRVTKGTKAYAGLRGRGGESGRCASQGDSGSTIDITMTGTVSR